MNLNNIWVHDFGKFKMVLDSTDKDISEQIKNFGWYKDEMITTQVFEKYLKPKMTVLDLGANVGFYTLLARSRVGPKGKVFTFEPSPQNANLIRKSLEKNFFDNVIVVEAAVADIVGRAPLYLAPDYISEHSLLDYYSSDPNVSQNKIDVKLITIDNYLEENAADMKVSFIKMDIEGSETRALKGMKMTLNENEHLILITEFWPNGFYLAKSTPKKYLESLKKFGFKIFHIDEFEKKVYPVTVKTMIGIAKFRIKNHVEKNKEAKYEDWYTNLLCIK